MRFAVAFSTVGLLALGLSACNQTGPPPAAVVVQPSSSSFVTPAGFKLPEGQGCLGDIARFRAVQDNDLQTGHVNKSVYERIKVEVDQAAAQCSAGNDGGARSTLANTKKRFGYPG
jgi:hypothetical protein